MRACVPDGDIRGKATVWCDNCSCVLYQGGIQVTDGTRCDEGFEMACIDTLDWEVR